MTMNKFELTIYCFWFIPKIRGILLWRKKENLVSNCPFIRPICLFLLVCGKSRNIQCPPYHHTRPNKFQVLMAHTPSDKCSMDTIWKSLDWLIKISLKTLTLMKPPSPVLPVRREAALTKT